MGINFKSSLDRQVQHRAFLMRQRNIIIASVVVMLHLFAVWALQSGLLMRAVEVVVPVEFLAQMIEPPKPAAPPPPPIAPKETPISVKQTVVKPTATVSAIPIVPQTLAAPQILTVETSTPAPNVPAPVQVASPTPILPPSVPVAAVTSSAPTAAVPAKVVLPSSDAEYLSNPKPPYPPTSMRLGEQGNVKVRIFIGADGLPKKTVLQQTSGFERLDQAALVAVMTWRYVPGKRGGVPEDMWMGTTISYVLE
jgi:periplasmic protein TonB